MTLADILILALVQGITELLPISSSGHLILIHDLLGHDLDPEANLALDASLHLGSLVAVAAYTRREVAVLLQGGVSLISGRTRAVPPLFWRVALATVPAVLVGVTLELVLGAEIRSSTLVAVNLLLFGVLLFASEHLIRPGRRIEALSPLEALAIGTAQAVALFPGVSRSGICMTAAMAAGYGRAEAARFALLLGVPAIGMAGAIKFAQLAANPGVIALGDVLIGMVAAGLSSWLAILILVGVARRFSFWPFALYRVVLGIAVLVFAA